MRSSQFACVDAREAIFAANGCLPDRSVSEQDRLDDANQAMQLTADRSVTTLEIL